MVSILKLGVYDEVHEMTDSKSIWMQSKQSQSTKLEPLIFIITTEGVVTQGFLDQKLAYAKKLIKEKLKMKSCSHGYIPKIGIEEI